VTQVNLTVKLAPGTHLHVTQETQTPDGHKLGSQSLDYGSHETQAAITLEILASRSEERRVGKECRSRWSPYH
jgi:hypothetical protein